MQRISRRVFLGGSAGLALATVNGGGAASETFPVKPINWLIFSSAGGSIDLTSRVFQPYLAQQGIQTYITYAAGGGARVALTQLHQADPDGYTIMTESGPTAIFSTLAGETQYDPIAFEPIFGWNVEGFAISSRKDGPLKTLDDLVALSKQRPITAGTFGRSTTAHLQLLLLRDALDLRLNLVHFGGSSQAYTQVIGGNIDIACAGPGSAARQEGVQVVSVFRDGREPALPETLSAKEQGHDIRSIEQFWYAMTTAGVPLPRIQKLASAFEMAFENEDWRSGQAKINVRGLTKLDRNTLKQRVGESAKLVNEYRQQLSL